MGTVYKQKVKRPVPKTAEMYTKNGAQWAKWKIREGKSISAEVKDGFVTLEVRTYSVRYKDENGDTRVVSTGLTDKELAQKVLYDLELQVRNANLGLTAPETRLADHQQTGIQEHLDAFLNNLRAKGCSEAYITTRRRYLLNTVSITGWKRLKDLHKDDFSRVLSKLAAEGKSAATKNSYLAGLSSFCNWAVETDRLPANPFSKLKKFNEGADTRRKRRSLNPEDIKNLLYVARWRPLAEHGRLCVSKQAPQGSGRKGKWVYAPLALEDMENCLKRAREKRKDDPELIARLDREGKERELIYRLFLQTGLRLNELRSLKVGDLQGSVLTLEARYAKNRKQSHLPIRSDLAQEVTEFTNEKKPVEPLLKVPTGLLRILERDCRAAGIQKRDERGRTVDVHALRHTFGTMLAVAGVAPRVAQEAMRHSKLELTMKLYTDPKMLDVKAAVESLPNL